MTARNENPPGQGARNENPPGQGADVEPAPAEKQTTTYVVFRQVEPVQGGPELWEQLPGLHTVPAGNKKAAVKAATKDLDAERKSGSFRAVGAGAWGVPIARKVETREVDDWS